MPKIAITLHLGCFPRLLVVLVVVAIFGGKKRQKNLVKKFFAQNEKTRVQYFWVFYLYPEFQIFLWKKFYYEYFTRSAKLD